MHLVDDGKCKTEALAPALALALTVILLHPCCLSSRCLGMIVRPANLAFKERLYYAIVLGY